MCATVPPGKRANVGKQLLRAEGLAQIAVGAEVKPAHFLGFAIMTGKEENKSGGLVGHAAADLEAVQFGHLDIQDDQIRTLLAPHLERLSAVKGAHNLIAEATQTVRQEIHRLTIIVNHQDLHARDSLSSDASRTQTRCA